MKNFKRTELCKIHLKISEPSPWVKKFAYLIPKGPILDVACGAGRHSTFFRKLGYAVTAIDRDTESIKSFKDKKIEIITADLEGQESHFAKGGILNNRQFSGIIVVNYLFRPLFPDLLKALQPGGTLIYETFGVGNELFSRPRNPKHLLKSGELISLVQSQLQIIAFE